MNQDKFLLELEKMIDKVKTGLLATVDTDGRPRLRWMSPAILRERRGALYAITSNNFSKLEQLKKNPQVEWMIQSRGLDRIMYVDGRMNVVENSSMINEVLEVVNPQLRVFWNVNNDQSSLVVLETVMEAGALFLPMKGHREEIKFE